MRMRDRVWAGAELVSDDRAARWPCCVAVWAELVGAAP